MLGKLQLSGRLMDTMLADMSRLNDCCTRELSLTKNLGGGLFKVRNGFTTPETLNSTNKQQLNNGK